MRRFGFLTLASVFLGSLAGPVSANLFLNGGFEDVPGPGSGQGLLPSDWISINQSADTYSNDGSFGLFPWEFGNFPGVTAHGGLRWVAGANVDQPSGGEIFGQVLSASLVAGVTYRVDGWLHQALRTDLNNPGGYDLWLDKGNFADRLYVGHLGDTTSPTAGWTSFFDEFVAPTNAAEYTRFSFAPIASGSWGTYPGLDDVSLTAVPEPASLLVIGIGAAALIRRRRSG
ncbi:MAG: PEP-CTERM sorting domain-containing protein [Methanoregulaceae archaeon]|nr:PEP-CTERM sorting domain-containing protein [Methanoregulaceae archaeon]